MTGPVRKTLSLIALVCAAIALTMCMLALAGYALALPTFYHIRMGYEAMSPFTALGLAALAGSQIVAARRRHEFADVLAGLAVVIGLGALASYGLTGHDVISPWLAERIFGPRPVVGRTSLATALSILLLALAGLPNVRKRPRLGDLVAAVALLIAALALLGYAYGAADLYTLPLFHTMAINTGCVIFLLACASILSQSEGGWAHAMALEGAAGRTTRRQLLFTLIPPVIGFVLVSGANAGIMRIGAAMALFVILTLAPLIWLILRDGKTLVALDRERRARAAAEQEHLATLEGRLSDQATQLRASNAERLALAQRDTERSESRYRQLFDSIDAGFCVVEMVFDEQGRACDYIFVEVNHAFEVNTGLKNAVGQRMRSLAPVHEQHWFDVYGEVATTGQSTRFELPAAALNNRWYDVHAFAVDDPAHNRVGILFNDVSDRKQAQLALEGINTTLERRIEETIAEREHAQAALRQSQKMEAMGQLTGGVAHDFNNLLTPIIGSLDLIARRGTNTERETRLIAGALQSADRAKTLVQRLLAFARRQPLQPGPVDIAQVVDAIRELTIATLGARIRVLTDVPSDLPAALADANQLEMALLNLAVNARDAMPDGGTLTITARQASATDDQTGRLVPGDYLLLSVGDTGLGMDAETRARATEPFFSTKGIGKGTGLGLSMVHGLAAQLGGALDIHSTPGVGTRIDLWLPKANAKAELVAHVEIDAVPELMLSPRTALVVDDEDAVRMTTADMLVDLGFTVLEAASAQDAEQQLRGRDGAIELVVTDHLMPGMTGADLARRIREIWPTIAVLLVSGYADAEGIAPDLPRLSKPFRQAELATAIADLR